MLLRRIKLLRVKVDIGLLLDQDKLRRVQDKEKRGAARLWLYFNSRRAVVLYCCKSRRWKYTPAGRGGRSSSMVCAPACKKS